MNVATMIIILIYAICLIFNKKIMHDLYNAFFYIVTPYMVIIIFNNFLFSKIGFFVIEEEIIYIHAIAFALFEIGVVLGEVYAQNFKIVLFSTPPYFYVNIKNAEKLMIISEIYVIISYINLYRSGNIRALVEGGGVQHLAAHINILMTVLAMFMLDGFMKTTKIRYLVHVGLCTLLQALSFIKYHVIVVLVIYYIYITIKDKKLVKKMSLPLVLCVIIFFCANYIIDFTSSNVLVGNSFYLHHFWGYVAGGTINLQNYLKSPVIDHPSLTKWMWSCVSVFPGMFANKLGIQLSKYRFISEIPNYWLGGSSSNVVSLIATVYVQSSFFAWAIFMIIWGWVIQVIYKRACKQTNDMNILVASVILGYSFLSFFSCFFSLSSPWETTVIAILVCYFLKERNGRQN